MVAFFLWRSTAVHYVVTLYNSVPIQTHANILIGTQIPVSGILRISLFFQLRINDMG